MANEEKSTAPRARVYILDIAVVLLALLLVVCLWQKNNIAYFFEADDTQKNYSVSFEVQGVRYDATQALTGGTRLYTDVGDGPVELGTLQDAPDILPYFETVSTPEGSVTVTYPNPDAAHCVTLNGTFTCRGVLRGDTLVLPALTLTVGGTLFVQTEYNDLLLRVVTVTENL